MCQQHQQRSQCGRQLEPSHSRIAARAAPRQAVSPMAARQRAYQSAPGCIAIHSITTRCRTAVCGWWLTAQFVYLQPWCKPPRAACGPAHTWARPNSGGPCSQQVRCPAEARLTVQCADACWLELAAPCTIRSGSSQTRAPGAAMGRAAGGRERRRLSQAAGGRCSGAVWMWGWCGWISQREVKRNMQQPASLPALHMPPPTHRAGRRATACCPRRRRTSGGGPPRQQRGHCCLGACRRHRARLPPDLWRGAAHRGRAGRAGRLGRDARAGAGVARGRHLDCRAGHVSRRARLQAGGCARRRQPAVGGGRRPPAVGGARRRRGAGYMLVWRHRQHAAGERQRPRQSAGAARLPPLPPMSRGAPASRRATASR